MRFLVDAQLPPALARFLSDHGHEAQHVVDAGLLSAPDSDIWRQAHESQAVIVTKDEDFSLRSALVPAAPVIVWVRLGNCRNAALLSAFAATLTRIEQAVAAGEKIVEIAPLAPSKPETGL